MKKKITATNRRFFLKWLPFNFCDGFCEGCEEFRDSCRVYQDELRFKAQCQLESKDPYDTKVVFENMGQIMQDTIKTFRETMEKEGIEITKGDEERSEKEEDSAEEKVRNSPLYKKCWDFSKNLSNFLEEFRNFLQQRPWWIAASLQGEMEELCFYCRLVPAKVYRALHSQIDERKYREKFSRPDSMVSGTLGFFSLATCEKRLEGISNLIKETEKTEDSKINILLKEIKNIKEEFKKVFPGVEDSRDKIIFHGRL